MAANHPRSRAQKLTRRDWTELAVPLVVIHALSIMSWILGTVTTRRLLTDDYRAEQFSGVFGWMSWDAGFYRRIAMLGYPSTETESLRFFPLYPGLGRMLRPLAGGNIDLALLVVAKVALVVAAVGFIRLVTMETGSRPTAHSALWVLALFPGSFVLTWGYSESLLLALAIWSFVLVRSGRFGWVIALGFAAGLCRPVGIALIAVVAVEALRSWRVVNGRERVIRLLATVAPGVGTVSFLVYSAWAHDNAWLPISIQDEFRKPMNPLSRIAELPSQIFGTDALSSGLHAPFAIAFVILAVLVFRRLPASYGLYTTIILVMALSADNLNSLERYAMSAFPLSIVAGMVIVRDERLRVGALVSGGGVFVGLCTLALLGAFVP